MSGEEHRGGAAGAWGGARTLHRQGVRGAWALRQGVRLTSGSGRRAGGEVGGGERQAWGTGAAGGGTTRTQCGTSSETGREETDLRLHANPHRSAG